MKIHSPYINDTLDPHYKAIPLALQFNVNYLPAAEFEVRDAIIRVANKEKTLHSLPFVDRVFATKKYKQALGEYKDASAQMMAMVSKTDEHSAAYKRILHARINVTTPMTQKDQRHHPNDANGIIKNATDLSYTDRS